MRSSKTGGNKEGLVTPGRLLDQLRRSASDETVPRVRIIRLQHDAALPPLADDLLLGRLFGGLVLDDVDVPGSRVFELLPRMKDLADLDRRVAAAAKEFGQRERVVQSAA